MGGRDTPTAEEEEEMASLDERGFNDAMSLLEVEQVHAYLAESSCYVQLSDSKRWTPMHTACQMGNLALIQALYDHGASLLATNTSGATPLHYWFGYGVRDPAPVEKFLEKLQHGEHAIPVDWNQPNNSGNTFLHYAVQGGASSLVSVVAPVFSLSLSLSLSLCICMGVYGCVLMWASYCER
jgi:Ankyrin repeats (3 copies)